MARPRGRFIDTEPSPGNLRLIWERLHALTDQQALHDAALAQHDADLLAQQQQLTTTAHTATQALITAGTPHTAISAGGTTPAPAPPLSDGGLGEAGCSSAGTDGHVSGSGLTVLGQIVCGTGAEYPALLAVTVDQPTRDANRYELLGRMIWHINLNGSFAAASRYPGNLFDLLVQIGTTQYAYRVTDYAEFGTPMQTVMVYGGQTVGGSTTPDPGISD